jgi:hypothetical protein
VDPDDIWWIGMLGSLAGRLGDVTVLPSRRDPTVEIARFLAGKINVDALDGLPSRFGLPVSLSDCYLHAGMIDGARFALASHRRDLEAEQRSFTWNDELSRCDLVEAEIELRCGNTSASRELLQKATQWIVQSGSQEHLCLLHLRKARLAIAEEQFDLALSIIDEGLLTAEQCGFGLYFIDLLCERARVLLRIGSCQDALRAAEIALNGIEAQKCQAGLERDALPSGREMLGASDPASSYLWGAARAGFFRGAASISLGLTDGTRCLESTLALQQKLCDPKAKETAQLLSEATSLNG